VTGFDNMALKLASYALVASCVLCGCADSRPGSGSVQSDTVEPVEAPAAQRTDSPGHDQSQPSPAEAAFVAAAETIIGFLQGNADYSVLALTDTVTLYLAPQSGGGVAKVPASALRDRSAWRVRSDEGLDYPLTPPAHFSHVTARFGRHFRCFEYHLADEIGELALLPHVGTRLQPDDYTSCLQTWNLTFVFQAGTMPPRLAAAVYDQWEW
jgi:hypothetical protein